jgi:hypothetical protein
MTTSTSRAVSVEAHIGGDSDNREQLAEKITRPDEAGAASHEVISLAITGQDEPSGAMSAPTVPRSVPRAQRDDARFAQKDQATGGRSGWFVRTSPMLQQAALRGERRRGRT